MVQDWCRASFWTESKSVRNVRRTCKGSDLKNITPEGRQRRNRFESLRDDSGDELESEEVLYAVDLVQEVVEVALDSGAANSACGLRQAS